MTSVTADRSERVDVGAGGEDRVALVCHPYHRGGVTRWMVDVAAEFRRQGMAVWFVAPVPRKPFPSGGGRPTMQSLLAELPRELQPTLVTPDVGVEFELGTVAYRAAVYARAIRTNVPAGTPCIVSDDPSVWEGAARVAGEYPMVGVLHGDDRAYYDLVHRYRDQLSSCVAVSRRIAAAAGRTGLPHMTVIPCGVPLRPLAAREVSESAGRLVWIGRMEEEFKRVSDLPRIASALRARGVHFQLDVVGDGAAEPALRHSLAELRLEDCVRLRGWLDAEDIWTLLSESDVLLLPSNREGMPVVMMEALAAGCAVVASRVSGVEDVASDRRATGVVFAHAIGDAEEAADYVESALALSAAARRQSSRRLAESLFSIEVCANAYRGMIHHADDDLAPTPRTGAPPWVEGLLSVPLATSRAARRALGMARRS